MRNVIFIIYILTFTLILSSCNEDRDNTTKSTTQINNQWAKGFQINTNINGYELTVTNPWQHAQDVQYKYLLSRNNSENQDKNTIHIPVKRVACMSTTHLAYIVELEEDKTINAISGKDYIYDTELQKRVKNGEISELGFSENMNLESIIELHPDVVFAYIVSTSELKQLQQLEELGIPIVMVGDYIEGHPLGKMEWLRFFACFYDKLELADSICNSVSTQYTNLRDSVSNNKSSSPNVMLNIPWQGVWWVPGGDSFTAKIIKDAGGNYLFKDYPGKESQAIDMELVYDRAKNAQIWLNTGMAKSKTEVFSSDNRLETFGSLDTLKLYNNNKRISISGNDFYESAVVHPERILSDLIKIFSFDEAETEDLYYYQKLK